MGIKFTEYSNEFMFLLEEQKEVTLQIFITDTARATGSLLIFTEKGLDLYFE